MTQSIAQAIASAAANRLDITTPTATDGAAVHALINRCPPLDPNSVYCNLLQCTHFAATSAIARYRANVVGFVSAYIPPPYAETLFVWQVAVDSAARGHGLARSLLTDILQRTACAGVRYVHTTVTASNVASRAMFERFAAQLDAPLRTTVMFDHKIHFKGQHDTEQLLEIGPFDPPTATTQD
jgi:L-2,4-diaminobutyric acid acetyltransferase